MQASTPLTGASFRLTEGPFYAADVCALTGISPTQLQHWTNKGYLGRSKVGLGRGTLRMYSAGEVEILAVGKELADCGTTPSVALEYAALIVSKAETVLAEYMARKIAAAKSAEAISDDLEKFMPLLVASIRMNPKRGRADFVQILTRDTFSIDNMFPDRKPTIMVPIGIIKIALAAMLSKIELSRPAKQGRTAATDKRAKKAKR